MPYTIEINPFVSIQNAMFLINVVNVDGDSLPNWIQITLTDEMK